VANEAMFDVASLTKVIATTTAIMQLIDKGMIGLEESAWKFIPQLSTGPKRQITIANLLAHTAGFPGAVPLYRECRSRSELLEAIFSIDLLYSPGTVRVYDDFGYVILGLIVERITGSSLSGYCANNIFQPLNMRDTMFLPPERLRERIMPTEIDEERGGLVRGVVHDEHAHLLGGVSGHAGMFSTAHDLGQFAKVVMGHDRSDSGKILSDESVRLMWSRQWQDREGEYGLGWDRIRTSYMNGIDDPDAVGHTGFTGVSLVISPQRDFALILLSNRVHPVRSDRAQIDLARRRLVEAVLRDW
jgi:CubicO group peptidase (beta-lactamase class C family)